MCSGEKSCGVFVILDTAKGGSEHGNKITGCAPGARAPSITTRTRCDYMAAFGKDNKPKEMVRTCLWWVTFRGAPYQKPDTRLGAPNRPPAWNLSGGPSSRLTWALFGGANGAWWVHYAPGRK